MFKALILSVAICLSAPAIAQEKEAGKAVTINYVKFKAGTIDRVSEIESKYFDPAAEKLGIKPVIIRMASGEWDRTYVFPLPGGMASLDYKTTKEQVAWLAEVDSMAGGKGMAQKLLAEWNAAVDHQRSEFGFSNQK
ncbi:MAG: hypothetical protein K2X59_03965 [Sphingomonas sp.]|nr:hypothetical protein [Sphingomonas sp.]